MLSISNLTYRIAGRPILSGCSATLYPNHRIGLVGRNGAGKSTLLRLISGDIAPDAGDIQLPGRWSMGMTTQEAPGGEQSLIDTVLDADRERADLLDALERPDCLRLRLALLRWERRGPGESGERMNRPSIWYSKRRGLAVCTALAPRRNEREYVLRKRKSAYPTAAIKTHVGRY